MSNTISKPQKVLSQISPFSFYTGVAMFVFGVLIGLGSFIYCIVSQQLNFFIITLGIIVLLSGVYYYIQTLRDIQKLIRENSSKVRSILKDKYTLKLKKNPLLYDELNCFLLSDPIPATLDGVDVEVLINLSADETDVVACIFNSSRTPLQIRSSEK